MPTFRLDVAYDGTDFHGYARQPDVRTVQETLEAGLSSVIGPVTTSVAGRTDAGVHAAHQVVSFSTEGPVDTDRLIRSLGKVLPPDISVYRCSESREEFSARFDAVSRTYRYTIDNGPVADPLLRRTAWHVPAPLDLEAMRDGSDYYVGTNDFASLCRRAEGRSTVRTVLWVSWEGEAGRMLTFEVAAESFCHQMVRSMVALAVEVGRGKLTADLVPAILSARDRNAARGAAPAHGLVLWDVSYG